MFIWQTNSGGSHGWILDVIYNKEMITPMMTWCDRMIHITFSKNVIIMEDMVKDNKILVTSLVDDIPSTFLYSSDISHPSLRWQFEKIKEYCGPSIRKMKLSNCFNKLIKWTVIGLSRNLDQLISKIKVRFTIYHDMIDKETPANQTCYSMILFYWSRWKTRVN